MAGVWLIGRSTGTSSQWETGALAKPGVSRGPPTGTTPGRDTGVAGFPAGSSRAITGLPALAMFAPRPLFLDLAQQVSTHLREGMIKVALVGGCHEVRPSR